METLGGDQSWLDRVIAEHAALLYYWMLIAFYLINPKTAYNFMQRVELHAYDTYGEPSPLSALTLPTLSVCLTLCLTDSLPLVLGTICC